jgi:iron complex outermembrane receptor protein
VGNKSPYTANYIECHPQYDALISKSLNAMIRVDYRLTGPTWFHVVQAQTNFTIFGSLATIAGHDAMPMGFSMCARGSRGRNEPDGLGTNVLNKHYLTEIMPAVEFVAISSRPAPARNTGWN